MILYRIVPFLFVLTGAIGLPTTHPNDADIVEESRFRESETAINDHKYYLSVSNVTYSSKAKALQMTSRFFIDDLEDVLNERMDTKMALGNPDGLEELKPILDKYISKRLNIQADGNALVSKVIGAEYDVDQIVVYIEFPILKQPKQVEMSYKALFELFPEQKNLVHFKLGEKRKSLLNSMDTPIDRVNF